MFGVPVIGSSTGGIPEALPSSAKDFLFEPGNLEECRKSITRLAQDREVLAKLSSDGRKHVEGMDVAGFVDGLFRLYRTVAVDQRELEMEREV